MYKLGARKPEVPLTTLSNGESGIIASIKHGHGMGGGRSYGFEKRLMDMGLTPGTRITVVKSAPFHRSFRNSCKGLKTCPRQRHG